MSPNDTYHQSNLNMPAAHQEAPPFNIPELPTGQAAKAEQASQTAELPQVHPSMAVSNPSPAQVPLSPLQPASPVAVPSGAGDDTPAVADDNDLIEQEWVSKAKAIVERTREDPHLQNKEINKVKADYIRKRYNKEVKLNEE